MCFKPFGLFFVLLLLVSPALAVDQQELKTPFEKMNYALGVNLVNNVRQQGMEIDLDLVVRGMKDAFANGELLLSTEELRKATVQYQTLIRQKKGLKAKPAVAENNKKAAEHYLAENKKKAGVITLPSGIQYKIIVKGDGRLPVDEDTVEYNYKGTLVNGKEFDNTYRSAKPVVAKVKDAAVKGVAEVLKLMSPGSRWEIAIPSHLAYGEQGHGKDIGPDQLLIYELELVAIK